MKKYESFLNITYDADKDKSTIRTNVKPEQVDGVLSEFVLLRMREGEEIRRPKRGKVYHINLKFNLYHNDFYVRDDTGSRGLTDGIVRHTIEHWTLEEKANGKSS